MPSLEDVARSITDWDGSLAGAIRIRHAVQGIPLPRSKGASAEERAVLLCRSAYGKSRPPELTRLARDPELARGMGPFLGDPRMGTWPFDDPMLVDDDVATGWLPILGAHAAVDGQIRELVKTLFRVRRRAVWIPASYALGAMAVRDDGLAELLAEDWARVYPGGLPLRWGERLSPAAPTDTTDAGDAADAIVHERRHLLHAACVWLAAGGSAEKLPGLELERFAGMALPDADASDASVVLLAFRALLGGSATRALALPHLAFRIREAACHPLVDDALRDLAAPLLDVPSEDAANAAIALEALEVVLCEPRWQEATGAARLDALWSWLETARWLRVRGKDTLVEEIYASAGAAAPLVRFALHGAGSDGAVNPVHASIARLAEVLDPDVWDTLVDERRAITLVELLLWLEHPAPAAARWSALVRRAHAAFAPQDGATRDVGRSDLALVCSERGYAARVLLADVRFSEKVLLHLAACQDGFVARQVAVEIERCLRQAGQAATATGEDGKTEPGIREAQATLMWRLLQRHPPAVTFRELQRVLRGGGTALHALVRALGEVNRLREMSVDKPRRKGRAAGGEGAGPRDVARAYARAVAETRRLLRQGGSSGDAEVPSLRIVEGIADGITAAAGLTLEEVGTPGWIETLRPVLLEGFGERGLAFCLQWAEPAPDDLTFRWARFASVATSVRDAGARVDLDLCDELDEAARSLLDGSRPMIWPVGQIVRHALELGRKFATDARERALERQTERARVLELLERGDEAAVARLARRDNVVHRLDPDDIRRVARFLLLRLRYRDAARLRARVGSSVRVPGPWTHIAPLFVGVSSGTFLVLDVGTAWNEVLLPGRAAQFLATVVAALLLAFGMLAGSLAALTPRLAGDPAPLWLLRICRRVLPTFAAAFVLACATAGAALWTLEGTDARIARDQPLPLGSEVLLWGSLSLFLGIFLGLVLQGRNTFQDG